MSRTMCTGGRVRGGLVVALGLVVGLGLTAEARAQCQASGSIDLDPPFTVLQPGDEFDLDVSIFNTSSVFPVPPPFVSATLTGTTTIQLACAGSSCNPNPLLMPPEFPLPGTLEFLPQPGTGCVAQAAGVASCQFGTDPANDVDIVMGAGVTLAPTTSTFIATIRVRAVNPVVVDPTGQFFMRADTGGNDIVADPATCGANQVGAGFGSLPFFFQATCDVQVDKQVSCGGPFVDVGFGDVVAEFCQAPMGGVVTVRYRARNNGSVQVTDCVITESNPGIEAAPIPVGDLDPLEEVTLPDDADQTCTPALAAGEPDTATLVCDCTAPFGGETRQDEDSADFDCEAMGKMGCWPVMP